MSNISFLRKQLFKNLSAFKCIYFVCDSEENDNLIFYIYCLKNFLIKKNRYIKPNGHYVLILFMILKTINTLIYLYGLFKP